MKLIESGDEGVLPLVGNLIRKVLVLDWRQLRRRFQIPRFQLIRANGGFGCQEDSSGKIFGQSIADGEDGTYRRSQFIGIAEDQLIHMAMADATPVKAIDTNLREYLLIARNGHHERGSTIEQARQRLGLITGSPVLAAYEVHPEAYVNEMGFIVSPEGAPALEVKITKGKVWTASH